MRPDLARDLLILLEHNRLSLSGGEAVRYAEIIVDIRNDANRPPPGASLEAIDCNSAS